MNSNKPNPAAGGRYVLGDDGAHIPANQVGKGSVASGKPAPAVNRKTSRREVKNGSGK